MPTPEEAARLFPDATPEERAEVLMKAGRISVEAMPYVAAHIRQAVEAKREACARICDEIQRQGDQRAHDSADPGEGSDGARVAAETIRALPPV